MAAKTKLLRDVAYEEIAAKYQYRLIALLDDTLQETGITDQTMRQDICAKFIFRLGNFHDQQWFMAKGQTFHPALCFTKEFLDTDTDVDNLGEVYAPSRSFDFHDCADGTVEVYFQDRTADSVDLLCGGVGFEVTEERALRVQKWLRDLLSKEDAEARLLARDDDPYGYGGTWADVYRKLLLASWQVGDEIWWFHADREAWERLEGQQGFALVREGTVVSFMIVGRS
jgi:hypothetical protein